MGALATARFWRALSTVLFVVFLVSLAVEGFSEVPGWGWLALIGSGATFAVELALVARDRSGRTT